ncbi:response regulator transcription factor [Sphingomonas populi]|uniref:Regulatory protein VirG n=1 Tax=Sphingomonas populi TaxID=2484750 RepID=A0A4Q6XLS9_9SPHN|nr:response regulator transcription factor [Sphingomonas populi]RZF61090.1 response regulator transcription factor [Sphingomonas populi]
MYPAESPHVALIEDDDEIRDLVTGLLAREGMTVHPCRTTAEFDALLAKRSVDLAIIDIMLPGEDGLSLCRRMRVIGDLPMLIVSARSDDVDRIIGLEIGADDYLPKPFNPRELVARVRALLRRSRGSDGPIAAPGGRRYSFAGWTWDADARHLLSPDGMAVDLTGGEHDLLHCLVTHPQRVLSREQLLEWTRGREAMPFDRTIDVQLGRLRRKLAIHPESETLIKTVRGGGYVFTPAVRRA